ncbi:hypothetical protein SBADM41S_01081 [Streptomyces badius]
MPYAVGQRGAVRQAGPQPARHDDVPCALDGRLGLLSAGPGEDLEVGDLSGLLDSTRRRTTSARSTAASAAALGERAGGEGREKLAHGLGHLRRGGQPSQAQTR